MYEDEKSLQITDSVPIENDLLLALSNPAGLVRLSESIAERGVYTSDLLDAGQPARWGKLQIEADIPDGCGVSFACRSGNVEDPNDPAFSEWSEEKELLRPEEMDCPVGRYAQYRLILHGCNAEQTPVIREVAVSHSIPNLAPRVAAVQVLPGKDKQKPHVMQIIAKADDENKDTLVYHYEFRRLGRDKWIKLEKDSVKPVAEWDTRTVEDGRYEVRVSADDKPTNSPSEALIGSRISDPVVVDNTPPKIEDADLKIEGQTLVLRFLASDAYSVVGKAQFTIDSNEKWAGILPEDLVFDTTEEWIRLQVDDLEKGNHILAIAVSDDPGNTAYQTFEFTVQ